MSALGIAWQHAADQPKENHDDKRKGAVTGALMRSHGCSSLLIICCGILTLEYHFSARPENKTKGRSSFGQKLAKRENTGAEAKFCGQNHRASGKLDGHALRPFFTCCSWCPSFGLVTGRRNHPSGYR